MVWSGLREAPGESGLELSLGLPAYFSKPSGQVGLDGEEPSGAVAFALQAKGSNGSKARPAAAPVVGWPPVQSFRRNLTSSSSKSSPQPSQNGRSKEDIVKAGTEKGLFVKINMGGFPIERKVDLKAYGSYAELCVVLCSIQYDGFMFLDGEEHMRGKIGSSVGN